MTNPQTTKDEVEDYIKSHNQPGDDNEGYLISANGLRRYANAIEARIIRKLGNGSCQTKQ